MKNFIDLHTNSSDIYFEKSVIKHPQNTIFTLHTHKDKLEILYFIKGDAEFRVEGSIYDMNPYDTIIASDNEMHKMIHRTATEYERYVIHLKTDFFIKNNCNEYSELFFGRQLGENNLIPYEVTKSTHLEQAFKRLEEYFDEDKNSPVINATVVEILHILHSTYTKSKSHSISNSHIKNVIAYINNNLTNDLTLESICDHFFINKSYLCRIFKKHTGYTVNKYITHKRIMLVRELCSKNMSITDARIEAGFGNYSNFYKMYLKETGTAPKTELKK